MTLEATCIIETSVPINMTCSSSATIEKGSILKFTSGMVATVTTGDTDPIIGIAAAEHIANKDGGNIPVWIEGFFRGYAGAAGVTAGQAIITDTATGTANELVNADVNSEQIVGRALTTATDGNTFEFQLNPFSVNLA